LDSAIIQACQDGDVELIKNRLQVEAGFLGKKDAKGLNALLIAASQKVLALKIFFLFV